eukprot:TRINITY_DN5749_c0_g1_i1.p1 TRINITY_DN5749_c0_g1~~TRINITY_DN5749_c0_g1_i1.p1  ORF type:complete len:531 (+),score=100.71 TRINITY_DN5749_c0_g1_i1:141-1733(+)
MSSAGSRDRKRSSSGRRSPHGQGVRMLRLEFKGQPYDWFNVDDMGDVVRSGDFANTLRENIAHYFGVPFECQAVFDEEGLLTTVVDYVRALQSVKPCLQVYDIRDMMPEVKEQAEQRLASIAAEVANAQRMFRAIGLPAGVGARDDRKGAETPQNLSMADAVRCEQRNANDSVVNGFRGIGGGSASAPVQTNGAREPQWSVSAVNDGVVTTAVVAAAGPSFGQAEPIAPTVAPPAPAAAPLGNMPPRSGTALGGAPDNIAAQIEAWRAGRPAPRDAYTGALGTPSAPEVASLGGDGFAGQQRRSEWPQLLRPADRAQTPPHPAPVGGPLLGGLQQQVTAPSLAPGGGRMPFVAGVEIDVNAARPNSAVSIGTAAGTQVVGAVQDCPVCGNTFMPDAQFCRKCGNRRPEASGGSVYMPDGRPLGVNNGIAPPTQQQQAPRTFEVMLSKDLSLGTRGQRFGFANMPTVCARALVVSWIDASGLLAQMNLRQPDRAVKEGDRILSVNGVSDDMEAMRTQLQMDAIRMVIQRIE